MAALATTADLEAVTGQEIDAGEDTVRAERLLELASAAVERWCNRTFAYIEDDEITIHVDDGVMFLPNGPVTEVSSVTGPSSPWLPTPSVVDPVGYAEIQGHVVRRYGWWGCGDYTVVYSHGYDPIPDAIVLAVCLMVDGALNGPGGGIRSESVGDYSVSYTDGFAALSVAPVSHLLAPYRRTVSSVQMVR